MHAACLMRRTFDPRELGSLKIVDNRLVAERVKLVKNEGDVRAVQLVKSGGVPFDVLAVGEMDDITRVHLFVYGARDVWELGQSPANAQEEPWMARMIAAQIGRLHDVELLALGAAEQDTGRDMLPGLLAAELGWELFSNVASLRVEGQRARLAHVTHWGTQEVDVALPICVSADDSCPIGTDPSDEYDLIEKLEKRASRKTTAAELGVAIAQNGVPELGAPPERNAQPVVALGGEVVAKVAEMLRRLQA